MAPTKERNFTPLIVTLSIAVNAIVAILFFLPEAEGLEHIDFTMPMLNAVFNSFTFVFLLMALYFIRKKNIKVHRNYGQLC
nr:hypothetical protein [Paenibacillus alkalitolerans]